MRKGSVAIALLAVGILVAFAVPTGFAQVTSGAWPSLHFDYENKRVTGESGPSPLGYNLTIHWSYQVGAGRSNPLVDANGRVYTIGLVSGALGPVQFLQCIVEDTEEETGCTVPDLLWREVERYSTTPWCTGALSPDGSKLFIAGVSGGQLVLECFSTMGDPSNPGAAMVLWSQAIDGTDASDLIVQPDESRLYLIGNNGSASVAYAFDFNGNMVWYYRTDDAPDLDPISSCAASPAIGTTIYEYRDEENPWYRAANCKTLYEPSIDGALYAMHTAVWANWQGPPPPMNPKRVQLKWSYTVSTEQLISSPVVIPRNWSWYKRQVPGTGTGPENPPLYYREGETTATIYICDPDGIVYCIEDGWWFERDWQFNETTGQWEETPPPLGDYNYYYTPHVRWSLDLGAPIASTPILTDNYLYVQDDTTLHAINIMPGSDPNNLGPSEGQVAWSAAADPTQPDDEWDFSADETYGIAPSPALDGEGFIWMVTRDGWLQVVASQTMPTYGLDAGDIAFRYFTYDPAGDTDHRGDENPPFYVEDTHGQQGMNIICSPIITSDTIYIKSEEGWLLKVKENVVGRYRFASVTPEVGYTEGNRMNRVPTVFTYNVDYFDPDCSSVGVDNDLVPPPNNNPDNSILLYIDGYYTYWRYSGDMGPQPYHIDVRDPSEPPRCSPPIWYGVPPWGNWEGMIYLTGTGDDNRRLGTYEYVSDGTVSNPGMREYPFYNQEGCHNYFFETVDGFGANSPLVSDVYEGPNMCPELFFVKTDVIFDGTISRPEKTVFHASVWYYDADEDGPAADARLIYLDNVAYSMQEDMVIGNAAVAWEDRYSITLNTTNDTPSFHFEFTDSPTHVEMGRPRDVPACTTRLPEYGQFFTLLLRDGKVTPTVGPPGRYVYSVRFFDPERRTTGIYDPPYNTSDDALRAYVYIDGEPHVMELLPGNGAQFDGLYTFETEYTEYGQHTFSFEFFYVKSMPDYNGCRGRGNLTSSEDGDPVEQQVVVARAAMPEFEFVGPTIAPWPSFNRYQDNNSEAGSVAGPQMPAVSVFGVGEPIKGTPVVGGSSSTIFFGSRDGNVYAVDSDLTSLLWQFDTGDFVDCTPALGQEGSLIVASRNGTVFSLDTATGELRWIFSAANIADSSPCVGVHGDVYIGSYTGTFYSIDGRRGELNWSYDLPSGGAVQSCAAEGTDCTVYFGSYDNYVYALNSAGLLLWTFKTNGIVNSSPAVETSGNIDTVYIGSDDQCVYRLDYDFAVGGPEPDMVWSYRTGGRIAYSSPAVDATDVYVASDALYAIDKFTGELDWSYRPDARIFGSVAVDALGTVYFGASDARLYAVRAPTDPDLIARKEGELVWWQHVGSEIWISGTALSPYVQGGPEYEAYNGQGPGELYFGCWDGNLYRIYDRGFNIPPELTSPSLSPSIGDSSQSFRFGVHYFDADGDVPMIKNVYIDGVAYEMVFTGVGQPADGEYEFYTDFELAKGTHSYYFEFSDGNWIGNTPVYLPADAPEKQYSGPIIDNKPELSDARVEPDYGEFDQQFVFSVMFSDPDQDPPVSSIVVIDGKSYVLSLPTGEGETAYNGVYTYTTTGEALGVGDHTFHFEFEYALNEWIRVPVVGEITGPRVNNSPVLDYGMVTPLAGDTRSEFTYSVHYKDIDGNPPATASVVIDGVRRPMTLYSDFDSDGTYQYTTTGELLGWGPHIFYFDFEDGQGGRTMLPAPPLEPFQGPSVNAVAELSEGKVTPISGDADVDFVFSVHYFDPDGVRPREVVLVLDGQSFAMTLQQGVITDGTYTRIVKGYDIGLGDDHSFHFEATDDFGSSCRFPEGAEEIGGPAVVEPGIYIPYWQVDKQRGLDTTLVISNVGTSQLTESVEVVIHLFGELGREVNTVVHQIGPGEQVRVDLSEYFMDTLSHFGSAKVSWERGAIVVWAMVKNGQFGQSISMTLKDPQIRSAYLSYWEVSTQATIDTMLALNNIGGTFVQPTVQFYDQSGQLVGATTVTIQPRCLALLRAGDILNVPDGSGTAVLTWQRGVLALWGMVWSEQTGRGYEVLFNQPFVGAADIPYWVYQTGSTAARSRKLDGMLEQVGGLMAQDVLAKLTTAIASSASRSSPAMRPVVGPKAGAAGTLRSSSTPAFQPPRVRGWRQNTPPILSDWTAVPDFPTTLTPVTMSIHYYDADADAPVQASIFVDGDERQMTLEEGEASDGRYSHTTFMSAGAHKVHCLFSDGYTEVRSPERGEYSITVEQETEQLDTWLAVTNLTETGADAIVSLFDSQGQVIASLRAPLAGLFSLQTFKISESFVPERFGSGQVSLGMASPVLNVWGLVYSETFQNGFALNFETRFDQPVHLPYWSVNDEYGVDTWISVANRAEQSGTVIVSLFDSLGNMTGLSIVDVGPNALRRVNLGEALFDGPGKVSGRGTLIWEGGEYLLFGAIRDLTNRSSYPVVFMHPKVHK